MIKEFKIIDKEDIPSFKFPTTDVLTEDYEIKMRLNDINRALSLGNLEHTKIKIFFEDDSSQKMVETTVWGVTDKNVILKQSIRIPIHRIFKIY